MLKELIHWDVLPFKEIGEQLLSHVGQTYPDRLAVRLIRLFGYIMDGWTDGIMNKLAVMP